MKIEEAMQWCRGERNFRTKESTQHQVMNICLSALEKQIPKEPAHKDGDYFCQVCGTYCGNVHEGMQKYCDECGQRLR